MSPKSPSDFDKAVGANIRAMRVAKGMSQEALATGLCVTFQQVQKYEKGSNRISIGRLKEIGEALNVDLEVLLQGVIKISLAISSSNEISGFLKTPGASDLIRAWLEAPRSIRAATLKLLKPTY